ncbi:MULTISPECIES: Crp/Fnr family transcriptional regulator [unclassified Variovorax]|uniref:Crp/Fnr family transcriptional regulator n=1 Tax=unclassified Variovorax TaxID=663243 RepID=UPI003F460153
MKTPHGAPENLALIKQGLAVTAVFSSWPDELLERLLPASRLRRHLRGDYVYSEALGEPEILAVVSGHLMVSRVGFDGSQVPLAILGPGFVSGMSRGLNPNDEALHGYRAHDDAVVVHLPARVVIHALGSDAALWKNMARVLSKQHRQIFTTVLDQLTGNTRQRLAAAIGRLAWIYGVDDETRSLRLRLSQDDLAAMLQVTRRSINREIHTLEDLGLIRSEYNGVTVLDLQALRKLGRNVAAEADA